MTQLVKKDHSILLRLSEQQKHMLWCLSVVYDTSMSDILRRILDRHTATIDVNDISESSLAMTQTQDEVQKGFQRLINHIDNAKHIIDVAKEQEWSGLERDVGTTAKAETKEKDEEKEEKTAIATS